MKELGRSQIVDNGLDYLGKWRASMARCYRHASLKLCGVVSILVAGDVTLSFYLLTIPYTDFGKNVLFDYVP